MSAHLAARPHARGELHEELFPAVIPGRGTDRFRLDLPMPGSARIRVTAGRGTHP